MDTAQISLESLLAQRRKFPALQNKKYLNFGAQGVMSQSAIDAILETYKFVQKEGPLSGKMFSWILKHCRELKELLCAEFGGEPANYALTQNATEGCNIILWGLDWQPGDTLLCGDSEHNGVMASVYQLCQRKKLNLKILNLAGQESDESLLAELDSAFNQNESQMPRLFLFSHVLWNTGKVLPLEKISRLCREKGIKTLVDGAQSAGVLPLDLSKAGADYYACTGHKWLCGPEGVGFLFIDAAALECIEPIFAGWRGSKFGPLGEPLGWLDGAGRFESATAAFPLLSGLKEAIKVHNAFANQKARYELIKKNIECLKKRLSEIEGLKLLDSGSLSGLLSFSIFGKDDMKLLTALEKRSFILRTIPNPPCLRVSLHYFSKPDLEGFVESLTEYSQS